MQVNLSASQLVVDQQAQAIAKQYGLDPTIFASLIYTESSFDPNIGANSLGYSGLGQLSPALVAANHIDPANAAQNLSVSAQTLKAFLTHYGGNYLNALSNYKGAENNPLARSQAQHVLDVAASGSMASGTGNVSASASDGAQGPSQAANAGPIVMTPLAPLPASSGSATANNSTSPGLLGTIYNDVAGAASSAASAAGNVMLYDPTNAVSSALGLNKIGSWLYSEMANFGLIVLGGAAIIGLLMYSAKDQIGGALETVAKVGA